MTLKNKSRSRSIIKFQLYTIAQHLGHYGFFLCFRWARALDLGSALQKKHVFFLPSARIKFLPIFVKKHLISLDEKKYSEKKQFHFR